MQIEQLSVYGPNPGAQAIQLRMRADGQNFVAGASLVVYDAQGKNPITLVTFSSILPNGAAGSRVLVVSACLTVKSTLTPDFTSDQLIPSSYLPAGRLTYEVGGAVYWSFAWGGLGYSGPNLGMLDNDADGDFGPPYDGNLVDMDLRAIHFDGPATALSTTNAADYALTPGAATYTNNAGVNTIYLGCTVFRDGFESGGTTNWSLVVP